MTNVREEEALTILESLSDEDFDRLRNAALTTKRFRFEDKILDVALFAIAFSFSLYCYFYIRNYRPPLTHNIVLLFAIMVLLPLAFLKAREILYTKIFMRAIKLQAKSEGLFD